MQDNSSLLSPQLYQHENQSGTVVAGFNLDVVKDFACALVKRGFVPVEDDYCLMEHRVTGQQGHFRKITFIKKHE